MADRPRNIDPKLWDEAVKKARELTKEMKEVDVVMDSISQKVTGLGLDVWLGEASKSSAQIRIEQENLNQLAAEMEATQSRLNSELQNTLTTNRQQFETALQNAGIYAGMTDQAAIHQGLLQLQQQTGFNILQQTGTLEQKYEFIQELLNGNVDALQNADAQLVSSLTNMNMFAQATQQTRNDLSGVVDRFAQAEAESQKLQKTVFDIKKGLEAYSKLLGKNVVEFIFEFDSALSDAQKTTGTLLKTNSAAMGDLIGKTAVYGMSISDTTELMAALGDNLRTISTDTMVTAAENFASLQAAIGVTSEEISTVAGELMRWGQSSEQVQQYFNDIHKDSQALGVNTKNVVRQVTQNIGKMRQFGFTEGEESLRRMAARAEMLRIDVGEIFNVAEQARTLEGALDMAAELQLAGGSFSNLNPMDLLAAARKGPEELGNILTSMGQDIGRFNENGEFKFDPIDVDRLQIVSKATGMSMEALQNQIMKSAEIAKKADVFGNAFSGLDGADKQLAESQFAQMLTIGENGQVEISKDFKDTFKKFGVDNNNLSSMNNSVAQEILKSRKAELDTLEERGKLNQSLEQTFTNFKQSFMSLMTVLQPTLDTLAQGMTYLSSVLADLSPTVKQMLGWGAVITYGVNKLTKLFTSKSLFQQIRGGFSRQAGGGMAQSAAGGAGGRGAGGGLGAGINGLAKGIKQASKHASKIKMMGMVKLAGALTLLGGVIVGFGAAIAAVGGEASLAQMGTAMGSMVILVGALALVSKISKGVDMGGVLKGSLAMAILGAALIPFSYALGMMADLPMGNVLAALGVITLATVGIIALGALLTGPQILAVVVGVATLIGIGAALAVAGAGLMVAAMGFEKLSTVNWGALTQMAGALFVATPALVAFGLGALAFANPLTIFGILAMTGNLALLAAVMIPLASSLTIGAEGMEKFANSINSLKAAVSDIDVGKLEELQETAAEMASASRNSAFDKLASTVQGLLGGGSGKDKQVMEHKIALEVYMDGKKMQSKILKETRQMVGR